MLHPCFTYFCFMHRLIRNYILAGLITLLIVFALYARIGFKSNVWWFELITIYVIYSVIKLIISPNFQSRKFNLNLKQIDISVIVLLVVISIFLGIFSYFSLAKPESSISKELPFGMQIPYFLLIISAIQIYILGFRKKVKFSTTGLEFSNDGMIYEIEYWEITKFELTNELLRLEVGDRHFELQLQYLADWKLEEALNRFSKFRNKQIEKRAIKTSV